MLRAAVRGWHRTIAAGPRWLARAYLSGVSAKSRWLLPASWARRVRNAVSVGVAWPAVELAPRAVTIAGVRMKLTPHLGEFDEEALFVRQLTYETAVFGWLAGAADDYDVVIEIGANVGVYAVFLDALARRPGARLKEIVSFEPSGEAFRRLQQNLAANRAANVTAFNAAVAETGGFLTFFEPEGHLTNGSFLRDFSATFSEAVAERTVLAVAAADLARWLARPGKALVKIDVEGFEPQLLTALSPLIEAHRPDLLIEVLEGAPGALEAIPALSGYRRLLITAAGLEEAPRLHAANDDRDWLLKWPA